MVRGSLFDLDQKNNFLSIINTTLLFLRNEFSVEKLNNRKLRGLSIRGDGLLSQLQVFSHVYNSTGFVMPMKH